MKRYRRWDSYSRRSCAVASGTVKVSASPTTISGLRPRAVEQMPLPAAAISDGPRPSTAVSRGPSLLVSLHQARHSTTPRVQDRQLHSTAPSSLRATRAPPGVPLNCAFGAFSTGTPLAMFRQGIYGRLASYEDVNDAERLRGVPLAACLPVCLRAQSFVGTGGQAARGTRRKRGKPRPRAR